MKTYGLFAAILAGCLLGSAAPARAAFVDATPSGMATMNNPGITWVDFDVDGDLDIFRADGNGTANELWRNDGDEDGDGVPSFENIAPGSAVLQNGGASNMGGAWADLDGDGDPDLLLNALGTGNRVLRNDGDGAFVDVSFAGLDATSSGRTPVWVDHDLDGDLDIYLADTSSGRLFRNNGGSWTTFAGAPLNVSAQSATFADTDGDRLPDLVTTSNSAQQLARNNGNSSFSTAGNIDNGVDGLATIPGDYDNDGDLDLFQPKLDSASPNRLLRNDGNNSYSDVASGDLLRTNTSALHACAADFDNDGDLDLLEGGYPDGIITLLRNDGGMVFTDVTADELPSPQNSGQQRAAGFADYDGDGDLDLFVSPLSADPNLYRNDLDNGNHWLHLDLQGTLSNASAVGAVVRVTAGGVTQMRYVSGGGDGWGSQETLRVEFGLGTETVALDVQVEWPSGQISVLSDVPADQLIRVVEEGLAPTITSYAPNQSFTFQVPLRGAPVDQMTLFFRVAGAGAAFQSAPMFPSGGGNAFEVGVGQSFATADGLEGYIEYTMNGGSQNAYPFLGAAGPAFLPAALPNQTLPELPAPSQYVMYGLPFSPANPLPTAVLEDDLGAYDRTLWRSFHFDPLAGSNGTYQEHPATEVFAPGRGFFLIMASPVAIGSTGFSTNTVGGANLLIERGWNQIAHPYQFPVALANVNFDDAPDVEQEIHEWDGTQYVTDNELEAWEGYFMFNAAAVAQLINIPGVTSTAPAPVAPRESLEDGWRLTFDASQAGTRDRGNELGVALEATDGPDRLDRHAPPAPPGAVRAYFEQVAVDGVPHELNRDLRASAQGTWDFVVEAPGEEGARFQVDGVQELPADLEAVLIPLDTWAAIDLRERSVVDLPGGRTHRFRVVVGSSSFVQGVRSGQQDLAIEFALGLGYPNPLSTSTKIGFALPSDSEVELEVFDVTGRKVRTLVSGTRSSGRHVAEWNARDEAGRSVAPGVYFVKLRAGAREDTRKLTVLR